MPWITERIPPQKSKFKIHIPKKVKSPCMREHNPRTRYIKHLKGLLAPHCYSKATGLRIYWRKRRKKSIKSIAGYIKAIAMSILRNANEAGFH